MKYSPISKAVGMVFSAVLLTCIPASAQKQIEATPTSLPSADFESPKQIFAGDTHAGNHRLFPSPVMYDVDGDKLADLVVADLFGRVTFAKANKDNPTTFGAKQPLLAKDGKPLEFSNW
jgi:hypothetical protein